MSGGGHLGPHEPGEFAGDGGDHGLAVGLAFIKATELATQAQLRGPRPGDDLGIEAFLAVFEHCPGGCRRSRNPAVGGVGVQVIPHLGVQVFPQWRGADERRGVHQFGSERV